MELRSGAEVHRKTRIAHENTYQTRLEEQEKKYDNNNTCHNVNKICNAWPLTLTFDVGGSKQERERDSDSICFFFFIILNCNLRHHFCSMNNSFPLLNLSVLFNVFISHADIIIIIIIIILNVVSTSKHHYYYYCCHEVVFFISKPLDLGWRTMTPFCQIKEVNKQNG